MCVSASRWVPRKHEISEKQMNTLQLHHGDCLEVLRTMPDNSVDSIVTDPPYGLSFMGKRWDYDVPSVEIWAECLRVLKPGGHLLAFAGTRTQHRMAVRIEDAGFEIRDMIAWVYGSGFPKSLDVSKAIDKAAGAEREVVRPNRYAGRRTEESEPYSGDACYGQYGIPGGETAPATEAARQWQGWGTALKPALEPITVARKPLLGTVAANVLQHGTGALNIDGCRVAGEPVPVFDTVGGRKFEQTHTQPERRTQQVGTSTAGRWPANMILQDCPDVVGVFPDARAACYATPSAERRLSQSQGVCYGKYAPHAGTGYSDTGSAARFFTKVTPEEEDLATAQRLFYCAKASKKDRNDGCEGMPKKLGPEAGGSRLSEVGRQGGYGAPRENHHPTVKPTALMAYLCRLVTPPGGVVLDPFMGSGSTGKAAIREGFRFIGIEREAEYVEISKARIASAQPQNDNSASHESPDLFGVA